MWTRYETYSTKFCLSVWDDENTANTDTEAYQARSYGVLHHAYLGFFEVNPILYVTDLDLMAVDAVETTAGLQSDYYYVATGSTKDNAKNNPAP